LTNLKEGGNLAIAFFPDSSLSWRARSQDIQIPSESRLRVFAIGITPSLKRVDGSIFGNVVTTFSSFELLNPPPASPGVADPVQPLPGFALCGGGEATHPSASGGYLFALEPTTLEDPITLANPTPVRILFPSEQSFTARSTSYNEKHTNTAYAIGIKFEPTENAPPPHECNNKLIVRPSTSSPNNFRQRMQ